MNENVAKLLMEYYKLRSKLTEISRKIIKSTGDFEYLLWLHIKKEKVVERLKQIDAQLAIAYRHR